MKLAIFSPTGTIGSRILNEALSRAHLVTAITRDPSRLSISHDNLTIVPGNVLDPSSVADTVKGHDAVLSSIGTTGSSVAVIAEAARSLIEGLSKVGMSRLVVVGGAGVLEIEPGVQFVDSPKFYEPYRPLGLVHREAYNLYKAADLDWTFVCPAGEIAPGERTGKFQIGADRLLTNKRGESKISAEDFAIAFVNEVETPQYIHRRLTIAY